jgi:hypothetical protein
MKERRKPTVNEKLNLGETLVIRRLGSRFPAGVRFDLFTELRKGGVVEITGKLTEGQMTKYADSLVSKGMMAKDGKSYYLTEFGGQVWEALMGYLAQNASTMRGRA